MKKTTVKPVDVMDLIIQEEELEHLVVFLCEKQYTLINLQNMIEKPYKYIDLYNKFLQSRKQYFEVREN